MQVTLTENPRNIPNVTVGKEYRAYSLSTDNQTAYILICDDNYEETGFPVMAKLNAFEVSKTDLPRCWRIYVRDTGISLCHPLHASFEFLEDSLTNLVPEAITVWKLIKREIDENLSATQTLAHP